MEKKQVTKFYDVDQENNAIEFFRGKLRKDHKAHYSELFNSLNLSTKIKHSFQKYSKSQQINFFLSKPLYFCLLGGIVSLQEGFLKPSGKVFTKIAGSVNFLLRCFEKLDYLNVKKVIMFIFDDVARYIYRLSPEEEMALISSIPNIVKNSGLLMMMTSCEMRTGHISADKKMLLFIICYLVLHGKTFQEHLMRQIKTLAPIEFDLAFGGSAAKRHEFLERHNAYFQVSSNSVMQLYEYYASYKCNYQGELFSSIPAQDLHQKITDKLDSLQISSISSSPSTKLVTLTRNSKTSSPKKDSNDNTENQIDKKDCLQKRFNTSVQFLLICFESLHHLEMTETICFVLTDVGVFLLEMKSSSRRAAFSVVPSTIMDELGFLQRNKPISLNLEVVSKEELLLLFIVYYLSLNGRSHFREVVKELTSRSPKVISLVLSGVSQQEYLGRHSQFFEMDSGGYLVLPSTFVLKLESSGESSDESSDRSVSSSISYDCGGGSSVSSADSGIKEEYLLSPTDYKHKGIEVDSRTELRKQRSASLSENKSIVEAQMAPETGFLKQRCDSLPESSCIRGILKSDVSTMKSKTSRVSFDEDENELFLYEDFSELSASSCSEEDSDSSGSLVASDAVSNYVKLCNFSKYSSQPKSSYVEAVTNNNCPFKKVNSVQKVVNEDLKKFSATNMNSLDTVSKYERAHASKNLIAATLYLLKYFEKKKLRSVLGVILLVLKDVRIYFSSLSLTDKKEIIKATLGPCVLGYSHIPFSIVAKTESFLSALEKELLFFSYSASSKHKIHYKELYNSYFEINKHIFKPRQTDSEILSYFNEFKEIFIVCKDGGVMSRSLPFLDFPSNFFQDVLLSCGKVLILPDDKFVNTNNGVSKNKSCFVLDKDGRNSDEFIQKRANSQDIWCKDNLYYQQLCTCVTFLLGAFGPQHYTHLLRCVSYVLHGIGKFLSELPKENQQVVFSSISSTRLSVDHCMKLTAAYEFSAINVSKFSLQLLYIASYLVLYGKTHYRKLLVDLYNSVPELAIDNFSLFDDARWIRSFTNSLSPYFDYNSNGTLSLPPSSDLLSLPSKAEKQKIHNDKPLANQWHDDRFDVKDENTEMSEQSANTGDCKSERKSLNIEASNRMILHALGTSSVSKDVKMSVQKSDLTDKEDFIDCRNTDSCDTFTIKELIHLGEEAQKSISTTKFQNEECPNVVGMPLVCNKEKHSKHNSEKSSLSLKNNYVKSLVDLNENDLCANNLVNSENIAHVVTNNESLIKDPTYKNILSDIKTKDKGLVLDKSNQECFINREISNLDTKEHAVAPKTKITTVNDDFIETDKHSPIMCNLDCNDFTPKETSMKELQSSSSILEEQQEAERRLFLEWLKEKKRSKKAEWQLDSYEWKLLEEDFLSEQKKMFERQLAEVRSSGELLRAKLRNPIEHLIEDKERKPAEMLSEAKGAKLTEGLREVKERNPTVQLLQIEDRKATEELTETKVTKPTEELIYAKETIKNSKTCSKNSIMAQSNRKSLKKVSNSNNNCSLNFTDTYPVTKTERPSKDLLHPKETSTLNPQELSGKAAKVEQSENSLLNAPSISHSTDTKSFNVVDKSTAVTTLKTVEIYSAAKVEQSENSLLNAPSISHSTNTKSFNVVDKTTAVTTVEIYSVTEKLSNAVTFDITNKSTSTQQMKFLEKQLDKKQTNSTSWYDHTLDNKKSDSLLNHNEPALLNILNENPSNIANSSSYIDKVAVTQRSSENLSLVKEAMASDVKGFHNADKVSHVKQNLIMLLNAYESSFYPLSSSKNKQSVIEDSKCVKQSNSSNSLYPFDDLYAIQTADYLSQSETKIHADTSTHISSVNLHSTKQTPSTSLSYDSSCVPNTKTCSLNSTNQDLSTQSNNPYNIPLDKEALLKDLQQLSSDTVGSSANETLLPNIKALPKQLQNQFPFLKVSKEKSPRNAETVNHNTTNSIVHAEIPTCNPMAETFCSKYAAKNTICRDLVTVNIAPNHSSPQVTSEKPLQPASLEDENILNCHDKDSIEKPLVKEINENQDTQIKHASNFVIPDDETGTYIKPIRDANLLKTNVDSSSKPAECQTPIKQAINFDICVTENANQVNPFRSLNNLKTNSKDTSSKPTECQTLINRSNKDYFPDCVKDGSIQLSSSMNVLKIENNVTLSKPTECQVPIKQAINFDVALGTKISDENKTISCVTESALHILNNNSITEPNKNKSLKKPVVIDGRNTPNQNICIPKPTSSAKTANGAIKDSLTELKKLTSSQSVSKQAVHKEFEIKPLDIKKALIESGKAMKSHVMPPDSENRLNIANYISVSNPKESTEKQLSSRQRTHSPGHIFTRIWNTKSSMGKASSSATTDNVAITDSLTELEKLTNDKLLSKHAVHDSITSKNVLLNKTPNIAFVNPRQSLTKSSATNIGNNKTSDDVSKVCSSITKYFDGKTLPDGVISEKITVYDPDTKDSASESNKFKKKPLLASSLISNSFNVPGYIINENVAEPKKSRKAIAEKQLLANQNISSNLKESSPINTESACEPKKLPIDKPLTNLAVLHNPKVATADCEESVETVESRPFFPKKSSLSNARVSNRGIVCISPAIKKSDKMKLLSNQVSAAEPEKLIKNSENSQTSAYDVKASSSHNRNNYFTEVKGLIEKPLLVKHNVFANLNIPSNVNVLCPGNKDFVGDPNAEVKELLPEKQACSFNSNDNRATTFCSDSHILRSPKPNYFWLKPSPSAVSAIEKCPTSKTLPLEENNLTSEKQSDKLTITTKILTNSTVVKVPSESSILNRPVQLTSIKNDELTNLTDRLSYLRDDSNKTEVDNTQTSSNTKTSNCFTKLKNLKIRKSLPSPSEKSPDAEQEASSKACSFNIITTVSSTAKEQYEILVPKKVDVHEKIYSRVQKGVEFLLKHFRCKLDFNVFCVVLHALCESKYAFLLLPEDKQMKLVEKIIATYDDTKRVSVASHSSKSSFQLRKEHEDLLVLSYILSQKQKTHWSDIVRQLKPHQKALPSIYFKASSKFFAVDQNGFVKLKDFPFKKNKVNLFSEVDNFMLQNARTPDCFVFPQNTSKNTRPFNISCAPSAIQSNHPAQSQTWANQRVTNYRDKSTTSYVSKGKQPTNVSSLNNAIKESTSQLERLSKSDLSSENQPIQKTLCLVSKDSFDQPIKLTESFAFEEIQPSTANILNIESNNAMNQPTKPAETPLLVNQTITNDELLKKPINCNASAENKTTTTLTSMSIISKDNPAKLKSDLSGVTHEDQPSTVNSPNIVENMSASLAENPTESLSMDEQQKNNKSGLCCNVSNGNPFNANVTALNAEVASIQLSKSPLLSTHAAHSNNKFETLCSETVCVKPDKNKELMENVCKENLLNKIQPPCYAEHQSLIEKLIELMLLNDNVNVKVSNSKCLSKSLKPIQAVVTNSSNSLTSASDVLDGTTFNTDKILSDGSIVSEKSYKSAELTVNAYLNRKVSATLLPNYSYLNMFASVGDRNSDLDWISCLSNIMHDAIAHLLKHFSVTLNFPFLSVILHALAGRDGERCSLFYVLPHEQQEEVVKASLENVCVNQKLEIYISKKKRIPRTCKLSDEEKHLLSITYIVCQAEGKLHHLEVFKKYEKLGHVVPLTDSERLEYFEMKFDSFDTFDLSGPRLKGFPIIELDLKSLAEGDILSDNIKLLHVSFTQPNYHLKCGSKCVLSQSPLINKINVSARKFYDRITESLILLSKNFNAITKGAMITTLLLVLNDLCTCLGDTSDFYINTLKELNSCLNTVNDDLQLLMCKPIMEFTNIEKDEKDLLVIICILIQSGSTLYKKLHKKYVIRGGNTEWKDPEDFFLYLEKKKEYFTINDKGEVDCTFLSIPPSSNLLLKDFFTGIKLKTTFQAALLSRTRKSAEAPSNLPGKKFRVPKNCIKQNILYSIDDVCNEILAVKKKCSVELLHAMTPKPLSKKNSTTKSKKSQLREALMADTSKCKVKGKAIKVSTCAKTSNVFLPRTFELNTDGSSNKHKVEQKDLKDSIKTKPNKIASYPASQPNVDEKSLNLLPQINFIPQCEATSEDIRVFTAGKSSEKGIRNDEEKLIPFKAFQEKSSKCNFPITSTKVNLSSEACAECKDLTPEIYADSTNRKKVPLCDCPKELFKDLKATGFFISVLSLYKTGLPVSTFEETLLSAPAEIQHYISCAYNDDVHSFLKSHGTFYCSPISGFAKKESTQVCNNKFLLGMYTSFDDFLSERNLNLMEKMNWSEMQPF
ncbi:hypothetical protein JTE90_017609 [Oedothorax gibbosus]|uniref:Uncharacterized protein n=1 Tax=Oedothorax gibbosus TaxID=931172 RepID=A0AAV6U391_9ARAC|nr:hypothetical protein JTE90_017609 [Oedothorax gibbosus]